MSLLDVVMDKNLIVITAALAALPLVAAVALTVISGLRRAAFSRKAARQQEALLRRSMAEASEAKAARPPRRRRESEGARQRPAPGPASQAPAQGPPQPPPVQPAKPAQAVEQAQQPAEQPEAEVVEQAPAAIQDILNSVFEDDDAMARYAVLLRGLGDVGASELLALANEVAKRLGGRNGAALAGGQEVGRS